MKNRAVHFFAALFWVFRPGPGLSLFLLSWLVLAGVRLGAQPAPDIRAGLPLIANYSSEQYPANGSNQAIVQDHRGVMYFGNQDGVLEFDGSRWALIRNANHSFPKALAVETFREEESSIRKPNRIYVGGIGEFGYLQTDSSGRMQYVSLTDRIPPEYTNFEDIWGIFPVEKGVVFQSSRHIFLLDKDRISVLGPEPSDPRQQFHTSFEVDGRFYVRLWGRGLLRLEGRSLALAPGGERFATERIYGMLPYAGDTLLIATRTQGLLLFDGQRYFPWPTEADRFLQQNGVYCAVRTHKGHFVFGTLRGGLVVLDQAGRIVQQLDQSTGLRDNLVFKLYADRDDNLWVGQIDGISHVSLNSPFRKLNAQVGVDGQGFVAILDRGTAWLGTVRNLFQMPWPRYPSPSGGSAPARAAPGSQSSTMSLTVAGGALLAAQTTGIIQLSDKGAVRTVLPNRIVFSFLPLRDHPDYLLAGTVNGLVLLKNLAPPASSEPLWTYQGDIDGFGESVFTMVEGQNGEIWVSDEQKGLFRIQLTPGYDQINSIMLYGPLQGLPAFSNNRVYAWVDGPIFTTEGGLYRYNRRKDHFEPDTRFPVVLRDGTAYIHTATGDKAGNLWLWVDFQGPSPAERRMELVRLQAVKNPAAGTPTYRLQRHSFRRLHDIYRSFLPNIMAFDERYMFFGAPSGFLLFDQQFPLPISTSFPTLIRKFEIITAGRDSLVFGGAFPGSFGIPELIQAPGRYPEIPFVNNDIRLVWSAPSFSAPELTRFQFQLEGFESDWNEWSAQTAKEYTNLAPGDYTFRVRAQNIFGAESWETTYQFEVLRPWYLTWWAILGYLGLATLFIWAIVQLNVRRLVRQKQQLEELVHNRTEEIQRQKTQIEAEMEKSEELLLNILPKETAEELKTYGNAKARRYESVTVLFADFKDFSSFARQMSPEELVRQIDRCFRAFDQIISKYPIEKIKTIGDAYMCAGGLPVVNHTHADDMINAALDIQAFMREYQRECEAVNRPSLKLRIGIHSGPVVAGIVGSKKYAYDIWGDTVNAAARVESSSKPGEVNISGDTYGLITGRFVCSYRGKVPVKSFGEIDMYFVQRAEEGRLQE